MTALSNMLEFLRCSATNQTASIPGPGKHSENARACEALFKTVAADSEAASVPFAPQERQRGLGKTAAHILEDGTVPAARDNP